MMTLYVREAGVNNAEAVQKIINNHFCTMVFEVKQTEEEGAFLTCRRYDDSKVKSGDDLFGLTSWPRAVKREMVYREGVNHDCRQWLVKQHGDDGFVGMLAEFAPYLIEPLTIQAVTLTTPGDEQETCPLDAAEWQVWPGVAEVEKNQFRHGEDSCVGTFARVLTSNVFRVSDRQAVLHIINGYHCTFQVSDNYADRTMLGFVGQSDPLAVKVDPNSTDRIGDLIRAQIGVNGQKGFEDLLIEIATYLRTPLVVQVVEANFGSAPNWAEQWEVYPGSKVVKHNILQDEDPTTQSIENSKESE